MKLLIAIPALNEEDSIEGIIQRTLEAREHIVSHSAVTAVQITVVSDGSTDRTVERALRYSDRIHCIVFEQNRGYGAAIKQAWLESDADLLAFLDADGTCDPRFFADLCHRLETDRADVVLGCRLNRDSRMPAIRRLGNFLFATLLSVLSSSRVRDTASGMRVVRRTSLRKLYPLPNGLHFTPAMSARAMLSENIRISEVDMPYHERAGESKLRVLRDGVRFLRVILESAFLYRPWRPLGIAAAVLFLIAAGLMIMPVIHYVQHRSVLEWMIYRFITSEVCGVAACLCFCSSYLSGRMIEIALAEELGGRIEIATRGFFESRWFWTVPAVLVLGGGALVLDSFLSLLTTGAIYEHWSRFVVMSFCMSAACILSLTKVVSMVLDLVDERTRYWRNSDSAARVQAIPAQAY